MAVSVVTNSFGYSLINIVDLGRDKFWVTSLFYRCFGIAAILNKFYIEKGPVLQLFGNGWCTCSATAKYRAWR